MTSVNSVTTQSAPSSIGADSTSPSTTLTSDYETFLQMLTVQMTNQDPLNPVESSDYAVQLATFSSVEQQVLTNELLSDLTSNLVSSNLETFGSWVGKSVKSDSPAVFSGDPIAFEVPPTTGADKRVVTVFDAQGQAVYSSEIGLAETEHSWSGQTDDGTTAPTGAYTFVVDAYIGEDVVASSTADTYSAVTEARIENGNIFLVLESGRKVSPDTVTALRD